MSVDLTSTQNFPEVVNGTLRMRGDRILVEPIDWDASKTIIAIRRGDPVRGKALAVGPGIYPVSKRIPIEGGRKTRVEFSTRFRPTEVKVGDILELGGLNIFDGKGYQFPKVVVNGVSCIIVTERDVAGIRDDFSEREAAEMLTGSWPPRPAHGNCSCGIPARFCTTDHTNGG